MERLGSSARTGEAEGGEMTHKGDDCYSVTRDELLEALGAGAYLTWWKFGPMAYDKRGGHPWKELHPRRDTVLKLIRDGVLIPSDDANSVQRECGMQTYRLAVKPSLKR
jgi:hypothetical protein